MPAQLFSSGLLMLISCLPEIMADMAILLDFPGLITWCDVCRTVEAVASLILQLHVIHILLGLVLGAFHCPKRVFQFLLRSVPGLWPLGVAASGGIVILHVGGIDLETNMCRWRQAGSFLESAWLWIVICGLIVCFMVVGFACSAIDEYTQPETVLRRRFLRLGIIVLCITVGGGVGGYCVYTRTLFEHPCDSTTRKAIMWIPPIGPSIVAFAIHLDPRPSRDHELVFRPPSNDACSGSLGQMTRAPPAVETDGHCVKV